MGCVLFISIVQFSRINFVLRQLLYLIRYILFRQVLFKILSSTFRFSFVAFAATNDSLPNYLSTVKYFFLYFLILFVNCFAATNDILSKPFFFVNTFLTKIHIYFYLSKKPCFRAFSSHESMIFNSFG